MMPFGTRRRADDAVAALRKRAAKMWQVAELTKLDLTHWVRSPEKMLGATVDAEAEGDGVAEARGAMVDALRQLHSTQTAYAAALHDRAVDVARGL